MFYKFIFNLKIKDGMLICLSVNINKVVLIWNVCLGNFLDLVQVVKDCEWFGVEGIIVYFCLDEWYICYSDIF